MNRLPSTEASRILTSIHFFSKRPSPSSQENGLPEKGSSPTKNSPLPSPWSKALSPFSALRCRRSRTLPVRSPSMSMSPAPSRNQRSWATVSSTCPNFAFRIEMPPLSMTSTRKSGLQTKPSSWKNSGQLSQVEPWSFPEMLHSAARAPFSISLSRETKCWWRGRLM